MLNEGADILDVGAISTRPGAREIPETEEVDRITPVIEAIRNEISGCRPFSGYLALRGSQDLTEAFRNPNDK